LPRQMPSPLALSSIAASGYDAMSVAKNISINPRKFSDSNKNPPSHSLLIRYFVMKVQAPIRLSRIGLETTQGTRRRRHSVTND